MSPSIQIAIWICVAFALGRLIAWATRRWRFARIAARVLVVLVALALVVSTFVQRVTWHVALIPIAAVVGVFTYGGRKFAPDVFR